MMEIVIGIVVGSVLAGLANCLLLYKLFTNKKLMGKLFEVSAEMSYNMMKKIEEMELDDLYK